MDKLTKKQLAFVGEIDFSKDNGNIVVVVQDQNTKEVLMTAFADREAISKTLETKQMWFRSRTRGLWHKGATSGNYLDVVSLYLDCDRDSILAIVNPQGPACHLGEVSCFRTSKQYVGE